MKWPKVIRTYLYLYTIILKSKNSLNIFMLLLSHIIGHSTIFFFFGFDPLFFFFYNIKYIKTSNILLGKKIAIQNEYVKSVG